MTENYLAIILDLFLRPENCSESNDATEKPSNISTHMPFHTLSPPLRSFATKSIPQVLALSALAGPRCPVSAAPAWGPRPEAAVNGGSRKGTSAEGKARPRGGCEPHGWQRLEPSAAPPGLPPGNRWSRVGLPAESGDAVAAQDAPAHPPSPASHLHP